MNENTNDEQSATAPPALVSPYPDAKYGDSANCMRLTIDVPKTDVYAIRTVRMDRGTIYFALQKFIYLLANECRRNNWNISNATDLEQFILERTSLTIDANTGATNRPNEDERRGTGGVRQDGASQANERPTRQRKQTKAGGQVTSGGSNSNPES